MLNFKIKLSVSHVFKYLFVIQFYVYLFSKLWKIKLPKYFIWDHLRMLSACFQKKKNNNPFNLSSLVLDLNIHSDHVSANQKVEFRFKKHFKEFFFFETIFQTGKILKPCLENQVKVSR